MMKRESFPIEDIYVPIARRATLNPKTVDELAENILQNGQKDPILVRRDGERFVLIEGLHRLEACRKLGGGSDHLRLPGAGAAALEHDPEKWEKIMRAVGAYPAAQPPRSPHRRPIR
jgi:sulfiredoxin